MPVDDLNQIFGDKLREAGLAVEQVEMDGLLHRCGTVAKPGGKDGAYIAMPILQLPSGGRTGRRGKTAHIAPSRKAL